MSQLIVNEWLQYSRAHVCARVAHMFVRSRVRVLCVCSFQPKACRGDSQRRDCPAR